MSNNRPAPIIAGAAMLLLSACALSAAGGNAPDSAFPEATFLRSTLDNGLSVIVVEDQTQPRVFLRLHFPLPSPQAEGGTVGAATAGVVAELLTRGKASRTSLAMAQEAEALGGHLGAGVDRSFMVVSLAFPGPDYSSGLELLAEVATGSTFPEAEVQATIRQQRARFETLGNDPGFLAGRFFRGVVLEGHVQGPGNGFPFPGTISRDDLAAFRDLVVTPADAVLLVATPLPPSEVEEAVREAFAGWEAAPSPPPVRTLAPSFPPPIPGARIHLVHRPGSTESALVAGTGVNLRPSVEGADDAAALETALQVGSERILAGLSGAIETTPRGSEGLPAPSRDALFHGSMVSGASLVRGSGTWGFQFTLRYPQPATASIVALVLRELDALGHGEPTAAALDAARERVRTARAIDGSAVVLGARLAEAEILGWPTESVLEEGRRLRDVTAGEVAAAARRYLPPRSAVVVVVADATTALEALEALAPVALWNPDGTPLPRERVLEFARMGDPGSPAMRKSLEARFSTLQPALDLGEHMHEAPSQARGTDGRANGLLVENGTMRREGLVSALPAPDSVLHGRILEVGSGRPVSAATVLLSDSRGNRRAGTFTRNDGTFSLSVGAHPGDELRVERLGYATLVHVLDRDRPVPPGVLELRLDLRPFEFSAIEVTAESRCGLVPSDAGRTYELWEATRVALQAAELTESEALVRHRTRTWQHRETEDATRAEARTWSEQVTVGRPFETLPPAVLAAQGYVQETGQGERIVNGPDARVLLSDDFAGSHCFRVVESAEEEGQSEGESWVGLAFEPSPEPADVVRIGGTIWLHPESGELRRIDFHFLRYQPRQGVWSHWGAGSGGTIHYRALEDGRWVVDAWSLRVLSGVGSPGIWYDVAGGRLLQVLDGEAGP